MLIAIPSLTRRHWTILALVVLATLWGSYDLALLPLALPQIAVGLSIPVAQLSNVGALIKLGSLPAFGFALAADHWGRRWLLIGAVCGFTLATAATALATTIPMFVVWQFLARLFVTVVATLGAVFIVEEFPAQARGWGMGALTGLSTVGGGMAAIFFAAIDRLPFGWRGLYVVGLCALICLPLWLLYLPETGRFQTRRSTRISEGQPQPLLQLLRGSPTRLLTLGALILFFNLGGDAALFYDPTYLQKAHGWQPWQVSTLNLSAGFMALLGSIVAGRLSDRLGRKRAAVIFLGAMPLFIIGYYHVSGWRLPLLWAGMLFSSIGATVILSASSGELFPTTYRATASGVVVALATISGSLSLAVHGQLVQLQLSPWSAISLLALFLLITPLLMLRLPETSGRALEEIAPEP